MDKWGVGLAALMSTASPLWAGSPPADTARLPSLCEKVQPPQGGFQILVQAAQSWPAYILTHEGLSYTVGVSKPENEVRYIDTSDTRFRTSEGLSVTNTLADATRASSAPVQYETGWAYYVDLPSGWSAAFEPTESPPSEMRRIRWFFRRRTGYGPCRAEPPNKELQLTRPPQAMEPRR